MSALTIRQATAEDLETIVAHNRAIAAETEGKALDEATLRRGVRRGMRRPERACYWLAEREGAVLGQLMITPEWSDWRDGQFWWIQSVYVRPAARRQGVYRALYEHVRAAAAEDPDVCGLRLYVDRDNRSAQRAYAALGMAPARYELYEIDDVLD